MRSSGVPYLLPMLILSGLFFLLPLVLLVLYSFTRDGAASLQNYAAFFDDPFNVKVLTATARLGIETVAGTTLLGLPVALLYWHSGPKVQQALVFLSLVPMLTSNVVRTFAWIVILGRQGPISQVLMATGATGAPVSLLFTELGLVLTMTQIDLPLIILPLVAVLSGTRRDLSDAAATAGAGPWRIFVTVLLPLMVPGLLAGWILVFASTSASFVTQAVIGGARNVYVPQLIYREVGILFDWPLASAIAVILLVLTGGTLLGLASLARHPRFARHA